ncbi:MAG: AprI/Inh family metalloprotease inhibitor [Xanthobacteraceae bacterium]|nr:AprI/Inh family metalloprotease inhibitor [Xanthobacteraceae bacterium]
MRALAHFAAMSFAVLIPSMASAQSDAIKALAGVWEISNADHDKTCAVTLAGENAAGGFRLDFNRTACAADFPPLKEAGAWNLVGDDVIQIVNPKGKILYEFTEVEGGIYESLRPGQPLTFLQNAAAAAPPPKTTGEMTGEWSVVRGASAPICALTLSLQPAGKDELSLKVQPGCDPAVLSFGPVSWHMEHGELVLKSARGPTWRFEEADGTWQRVPEGTDPIMLVRP